jgi:endonuclease/exonuclease/phosphatase family metal-dependent hydrolase
LSRHPGDRPEGFATEPAVSVITLNCLWHTNARARLRRIAELVEASDADVVCLQEVIYRARLGLLRELSPSRPHLAFEPFGPWVKGGLVTISRWPIERRGYTAFRRCGRWTDISAADRWLRKGFLTTWHRAPWGAIAVVNTHLLANYDEDWSPGNRYLLQQEDEVAQLVDWLAEIEPATALVAAGDFNLPGTVPAYRRLLEEGRLADVTAEVPLERPEAAIDHVLARPPAGHLADGRASLPFQGAVALVGGRPAAISDHPAIGARVRFLAEAG